MSRSTTCRMPSPATAIRTTDPERCGARLTGSAAFRQTRAMSDDRLLGARILAAADADRRQFERRLHDGAQQSLAVIAMKLQLARAADDPTALLGEIAADVDDAVAELRELARLLHPPLHGQRGLATALRAAASALDLQVELHVEAVEPAEAVYLCCAGILEAAGQRASVTI